MKQLNLAEAKAKLSHLVDQAAKGRGVIIAKFGIPMAKLVPLDDEKPKEFVFGTLRGVLSDEVADAIAAPLPGEILDVMLNGPFELRCRKVRLLLDTSIVVRLRQDERQIDSKTRRIIENAAVVYVSSASIWEIAIKASVRKLDIDIGRLEAGLLDAGIKPLPITWTHARRAYDIAAAHPDPFDRLLLAQAICEPLHLLTSDGRMAQYSALVVTV